MKPTTLRDAEDAVAEERERQDRLGARGSRRRRRPRAAATPPTISASISGEPQAYVRAAEAREEHDRGERRRRAARRRGSRSCAARASAREWNDDRDHDEREHADRQVDVEDPAPGQVVDEEAAEQRADHRRDAEDGAEEALVAAALARRDDVADHGDRDHDQPAAAEPLERAEGDQLAPCSALSPQSAEPTRKITIAVCSTSLRP